MNVSRTGRIRKRSSKLIDFEFPEEIDNVTKISKAPEISVSYLFIENKIRINIFRTLPHLRNNKNIKTLAFAKYENSFTSQSKNIFLEEWKQ